MFRVYSDSEVRCSDVINCQDLSALKTSVFHINSFPVAIAMDPSMLQLGRECHAKTSALEMIGHPSYGDTCALSHMSWVKHP